MKFKNPFVRIIIHEVVNCPANIKAPVQIAIMTSSFPTVHTEKGEFKGDRWSACANTTVLCQHNIKR